jgi:hypothetical protein
MQRERFLKASTKTFHALEHLLQLQLSELLL